MLYLQPILQGKRNRYLIFQIFRDRYRKKFYRNIKTNKDIYTNVHWLMKIFTTLPMFTCVTDRSLSILKRIKI